MSLPVLSPKVKTSVAAGVPVVLLLLSLLLPKYAPSIPLYVPVVIQVLLAAVAVLNVFHVSAAAVAVLQALIDALQATTAANNPLAKSACAAAKQLTKSVNVPANDNSSPPADSAEPTDQKAAS